MKTKKRNAVFLTIAILILGIILNFLLEMMPPDFKNTVAGAAGGIGVSYTQFWILLTLLVIIVTLIFVWKQARTENEKPDYAGKTVIKKKRAPKQYGDKSIYIEKNKGDINVN